MKKKLLASAAILLSINAMAQLPVSTIPENRNVVLEEFTGIHCTWCPDGHLVAATIKAANPNDFFIVNIHEGSFSTPQAGEPDFRTTEGDAIGQLAGSSSIGWPSGSISRHVFTGTAIAHSRGDWATNTATVIAQPSYVNVAVEADIDVATRMMTIDLEAYFTANGPASVNVNIAITQDNIEGPQTGMAGNPANVLPNGNYNHGHVFRGFATGQWGDVVTTTTMGTTYSKQYSWPVPTDINGVPVEIGDLNIVAFIAEGQTEVITANGGPISYTLPSGSVLVDLESSDAMTAPTSYCVTSVTPEITVTNNETASCSGYEVSYSLDGGTAVTKTVNTALPGGASATTAFAAVTLASGGNHTLEYTVELISGTNEVEIVTGNNGSASAPFLSVAPTTVATPKSEGFESVSGGGFPTGTYSEGNLSSFSVFAIGDLSSSSSQAIGGYGQSDQSVFFYFWNNASGNVGSIFFDKLDLANKASASLTFDRAFTTWQGTNDKLEAFISNDCGATWTSVWSKSGSALATAPELNQNNAFFIPTDSQWATDTISLDSYIGDEVLVKLVGTSDFGDCLYVDNVNVNGEPLGISDLSNANDISVYPNPAVNNTTISIVSVDASAASIKIMDIVGKTVINMANVNLNNGDNNVDVNTTDLEAGVYVIEVTINGEVSTSQLVIQK